MRSGTWARRAALLVAVLAALGVSPGRAAQTTTYTAPYSSHFAARGCSDGYGTGTCVSSAEADENGLLRTSVALSTVTGLGSGYAESRIGLDIPLEADAFAVVLTATVHVADADVAFEPGAVPSLLFGRPYAYASLAAEGSQIGCDCAYGYDYVELPPYDEPHVQNRDVVVRARIENYNAGNGLVPAGTIHLELRVAMYAASSLLSSGSASGSIDAVVSSVEAAVIAP